MTEMLIGVAAHVSRLAMAQALARKVGAQVLNVDQTHAEAFDEKLSACVANHLAVIERLEALIDWSKPDPPWCVVLEDDAIPVKDFRVHAAAALKHVPVTGMAGFYVARSGVALNEKPLKDAYDHGIRWFSAHHLNSAVAYAFRTTLLPGIIASFKRANPSDTVERIFTDYALQRRVNVGSEPRFYYMIPSLVDHSTTQSIITPDVDGEVRRAWKFGVADDWATPSVDYDP